MRDALAFFGIVGFVMMGVLHYLRHRMFAPFGCGSSIKTYDACMDEHCVWQIRVSIFAYCMLVASLTAMLISFSGVLPRFPTSAYLAIFGMAVASAFFLVNATQWQRIHRVCYFTGSLLWTISSTALVFIGLV